MGSIYRFKMDTNIDHTFGGFMARVDTLRASTPVTLGVEQLLFRQGICNSSPILAYRCKDCF